MSKQGKLIQIDNTKFSKSTLRWFQTYKPLCVHLYTCSKFEFDSDKMNPTYYRQVKGILKSNIAKWNEDKPEFRNRFIIDLTAPITSLYTQGGKLFVSVDLTLYYTKPPEKINKEIMNQNKQLLHQLVISIQNVLFTKYT